jgi:triose/dihydroxyacetone kinase / FAD-AMP lyase (cyclizing)
MKFSANDVRQSLEGLCLSRPELSLTTDNVLYLATHSAAAAAVSAQSLCKVSLISGGGSGHEPAHVGFIADGMLDAVVCGNLFASPSTTQVLTALERVCTTTAGALMIIKNYTGDRLQFGRAVEKWRVMYPDRPVRMVVVGEDCSIPSDRVTAGRRGLAGM